MNPQRPRLGQVLRLLAVGWRRADRRVEAGEAGGFSEVRTRWRRSGPVDVRLVLRLDYRHL